MVKTPGGLLRTPRALQGNFKETLGKPQGHPQGPPREPLTKFKKTPGTPKEILTEGKPTLENLRKPEDIPRKPRNHRKKHGEQTENST